MTGDQYASQAHDHLDVSERTAVTYEAEQAASLGRAQVCALLAIYDALRSIDDALRNTVGGRSVTGRRGAPPLGSAAREATAPARHGKHRQPEACPHIARIGMTTLEDITCQDQPGHMGMCRFEDATRVILWRRKAEAIDYSDPDPDPDRCPSCGQPWQAGQASCCGQDRNDGV